MFSGTHTGSCVSQPTPAVTAQAWGKLHPPVVLCREEWQVGANEDWRFTDMAQTMPRHWWWVKFWATYVSQQPMLVGLTLPLYAIHTSQQPWNVSEEQYIVGICLTGAPPRPPTRASACPHQAAPTRATNARLPPCCAACLMTRGSSRLCTCRVLVCPADCLSIVCRLSACLTVSVTFCSI